MTGGDRMQHRHVASKPLQSCGLARAGERAHCEGRGCWGGSAASTFTRLRIAQAGALSRRQLYPTMRVVRPQATFLTSLKQDSQPIGTSAARPASGAPDISCTYVIVHCIPPPRPRCRIRYTSTYRTPSRSALELRHGPPAAQFALRLLHPIQHQPGLAVALTCRAVHRRAHALTHELIQRGRSRRGLLRRRWG